MSFKCEVCGKGPVAGNTISHSHMKSKRVFRPNLVKQKVMIDGKVRTKCLCTRCLRSGKIKKA